MERSASLVSKLQDITDPRPGEDDFARIDVAELHTSEKGHGRLDDRSYYTCPIPDDLPDMKRWKGLAAIGISINNTERRSGDEIAVRYYILSKRLSGEEFASAVRDHWGIENSCHWQLVEYGDTQLLEKAIQVGLSLLL